MRSRFASFAARPGAVRLLAVTAAVLSLIIAAGARTPVASERPRNLAPVAPPVTFDLLGVVEGVRLAFRETADGFRAAPSFQTVEVRGGGFELTPAVASGRPPSPLRFETRSVRRGSEELWGGASAAVRVARDEVERAAGRVAERLKSTAAGLEQSWHFDERPGGTGDLVVSIGVDAPLLAKTSGGLHFGSGGAPVRYGHATWVDARGTRTPVEAEWSGQAIVLTVPAALVEASGFPAVLDPLVSAELAVDQPITIAATTNDTAPAIAWNGTNFLAVFAATGEIIGVRLNTSGVPLDPAGFTIAPAGSGARNNPDVASDGVDFYVAWATGTDVYGTRVTAAGTSPAPEVTLTTGAVSGVEFRDVSVAYGGGSYLVAWTKFFTESGFDDLGIDLAVVSTAGAKVTENSLYDAAAVRQEPDLAYDGSEFLLVWRDQQAGPYNIWARRVTPGTAAFPAAGFAVTTSNDVRGRPRIAWNGNRHLVTWPTNRGAPTSYQVVAALVLGNPATVTPNTTTGIQVTTNTGLKYAPAVAAFGTSGTGTGFLVAWQEGTEIRGARITNSGTVTDTTSLILASGSGTRSAPALAATSGGAMLAWEDLRTGNSDVWGRTVSTVGTTGTETRLSSATPEQLASAVAFGASTYLVVWQDRRTTTGTDIYGARFNATGTPLDSAAFPISTAPGSQTTPAVTFVSGGGHFLVAWNDGRDGGENIIGARVTPTGTVLDPAGLVVSNAVSNQSQPAVASSGSSALVTWTDRRNMSTSADIYGTLVFPDAGVSPAPSVGIAISTATSLQQKPAVAWNGQHYLVAWEDFRSSTSWDIYGARVTSAGAVSDPGGVVISSTTSLEGQVSAGSVGGTVLVAWATTVDGGHNDVYGRMMSTTPSLTGGSSVAFATGASHQSLPAVSGDGTNFQLTWTVARGEDAGFVNALLGTRVATNGGALDDAGIVISPSNGAPRQGGSAIASSGTREFLVSYDRFDPSTTFNTNRVRVRRLSNAPPVGTPQSVATNEDTPRLITLEGTDADGDSPLSFTLGAAPMHGTLSGPPPNVTYSPAANYAGPDSFTFTVSDGFSTSAPATVSIDVVAQNDVPVALAQSVSTAEDTPRVITLTGTDVEGSNLTFAIATTPGSGTLGPLTGNTVTYTPGLNFSGTDSFTFRVNDGTADSSKAQVSITVTPVNDPPVANQTSVTTPEDTAVPVVLTGFDVEGSALTFLVVTNPTNGTLSGMPPTLTYTPAANFAGPDAFTFKVNDGAIDSATVQVTLTVFPVNDPPVAQNSAVGTDRDTARIITLQASDVDSPALNYVVVTPPTNGTLSGSGASRTYTPSAGYAGNDSFTFKANDGAADSNIATVTIDVGATNRAPMVTSQMVTAVEDTARSLTLGGTDADGDQLTFIIVAPPTHGTVTNAGSPANFTYQPASNYSGPDTFTFKANDGRIDSVTTATVTITVTPVDDVPMANSASLSVAEDSTLTFSLSGSDAEGSPLTFSQPTMPMNGTLTGTPPMLQYQPNPNFNGSDSIQFTVSDGSLVSAPATVFIAVTPVNDAPTAQPQSVSTSQDTPRNITLLATDIDSTALTFTIVTQPGNGTLSGTPPTVTYTPNPNFRGNDTFTFKVSDGVQDSAPAAVGISVSATNRAPVAASQNLTVGEDEPLAVTLAATDQDGDPLTYSITAQPTKGTLSGTPPNLTYTPNANATGLDTFVFRANDGTVDSNDATVRVTVTPVGDPPVALGQPVTTPEDSAVSIVLSATDPDPMDMLTWTLEMMPSQGTLTGNPPNLTYTPNANYSGSDSLTFKVSDGTFESAPATVAITVTPVNDAPVASPVSESTVESTPVEVTLLGSDAENDALSFAVTVPPAQGALTGEPPVLVYTPKPGFTGTDSFSYTATDGAATSPAAAVTITVTPAGGTTTRDTTRLNGWSCGCSSGAADAAVWALGLLALGALRRRRVAPVVVAAAIALALPAVAAPRPATKKSATSKKAPAPPAPEPAPTPEPAPAPVEPVSPAPVAEAPKGPPSLAALDVAVTVSNEKLDATAFSEMLTTAVDQSKLFKVISSQDIATMLGIERQRSLLGCTDDTSCLTEIADALGTAFVMQGTVGKVGDTYLVTVRLIDSKRSRVVGRGAGQTGDANLLLNLIWKSTQEAIDAWGTTLPPEEGRQVAARPQVAPLKAVAPPRSKLGVIVAVVGGYQPLAPEGSRGSVGGEVAASWRLGRLDLGAGVVISPTPGARIFGMLALTQGQHRVSVGLRASAFFGAAAYGGGPAVEYELGLGETFGLRVLGAGEVYGSQQGLVLALLAGLGASARF